MVFGESPYSYRPANRSDDLRDETIEELIWIRQ